MKIKREQQHLYKKRVIHNDPLLLYKNVYNTYTSSNYYINTNKFTGFNILFITYDYLFGHGIYAYTRAMHI